MRAPKTRRTAPRRDNRPNSNRRGYGHRWRVFRSWFLARHPFCADCAEAGRLTKANEVHHVRKVVDHPELQFVEDNCRALCRRCHSRLTAQGL